MVQIQPVHVGEYTLIAFEVKLPKTTLLGVCTDRGYVMCGALDVQLLRGTLADRGIVAARAVGVRTVDDLLNGTVESSTQSAEAIGIVAGMPIREALIRMREAELAGSSPYVS